jgi:transcriptional regulator with XRE-family HTH domain
MDGRYLQLLREPEKISQSEIAKTLGLMRGEVVYTEQTLSASEDWIGKYEEAIKKILTNRRQRRVNTFEKVRLRVKEDAAARAAKQAAKKGKE